MKRNSLVALAASGVAIAASAGVNAGRNPVFFAVVGGAWLLVAVIRVAGAIRQADNP